MMRSCFIGATFANLILYSRTILPMIILPLSLQLDRIDPIGCEDVDDALSVKLLPNGNVELGVHIADVSFFVKPGWSYKRYRLMLMWLSGSLTDAEARLRGTTEYLADRRYDMLPSVWSFRSRFILFNVLGSQHQYMFAAWRR